MGVLFNLIAVLKQCGMLSILSTTGHLFIVLACGNGNFMYVYSTLMFMRSENHCV